MSTSNRRALLLGLAREGVSLARYLAERGDEVTVTDVAPASKLANGLQALRDLPIKTALGGDHPELVAGASVLYVSPGVPETNPVYLAARSAGIPVESMTTLFFDLCPAPILAVTGSSGKTTTTGLIAHLLRASGRDVALGGNIGSPMLDLLPTIGTETVVVVELSSFQLSLLRRSPHIAVVTNISPNHLDRHGTMDEYIAAKRHIVDFQTADDFAVLNRDDDSSSIFAAATRAQPRWFSRGRRVSDGADEREGVLGVVKEGHFTPVMNTGEVPLLGDHNRENVLAAMAACALLDLRPEAMRQAVKTFQPAPHRLQTVAEQDGVHFVDDSIATSPARAVVALKAVATPVLLIAGGRDKHLPWDEFAFCAVRKAKAVFLMGEAAPLIQRALRATLASDPGGLLSSGAIHRCDSLEQAVDAARRLARPGDTVLLSPGCTSYDMFQDFEDRGEAFRRAVEALYAA